MVNINIGKHMEMFGFKFQQNRNINEEFDFFEGGRGGGAKGLLFINLNLNYY